MPFGDYTGVYEIETLVEMVHDRNLAIEKRILAVVDLSLTDDFDSHRLLNTATDQSQPSALRGEIFDQHVWKWDERSIPVILNALQENNDEIQFWAAFALVSVRYYWKQSELDKMISLLDKVGRYDSIAPDMWHVGREALYPLECAYYRKINTEKYDTITFRLISPRLEYWDFKMARQRGDVIVEPTLQINPDWLLEKIASRFKSAKFAVRRPKPDAYLMDWRIGYGKFPLYGALHRDQFGIVLCGLEASIQRFAEWYRTIISEEHELRIYDWADPGEKL